ncbi:MAG: NTP transferase domain-containing protein [Theionarchaea archaeon]|nr:NTP transferase domain-containing protein [Theionarchaea archaeon]
MNTGFLITARLKSKRLPLKLLKDLHGQSVIHRVIQRAQTVSSIDEVVLCTSTHPQDKKLVDIARETGISYFTGDEDDVLQRLCDAAQAFDLDFFLSITADNPLFSMVYADKVADSFQNNPDFVIVTHLPLGTAVYGLNTRAVRVACAAKSIVDTEIWGYLLNQPHIFNVHTIATHGIYHNPHLRLTLDYEEDYQLISTLYDAIPFHSVLPLSAVLEYLHNHSQIARLNQECHQRGLDTSLKEEIDRVYKENHDKIMHLKEKIYADNNNTM